METTDFDKIKNGAWIAYTPYTRAGFRLSGDMKVIDKMEHSMKCELLGGDEYFWIHKYQLKDKEYCKDFGRVAPSCKYLDAELKENKEYNEFKRNKRA